MVKVGGIFLAFSYSTLPWHVQRKDGTITKQIANKLTWLCEE